MCFTPSGREASRPHAARLRASRRELVLRDAVWAELERRGATLASVSFSGRAGAGGTVGTIALSRVEGDALAEVEQWTGGPDELPYALDAPVWDRYGTFAGQPRVYGTVVWSMSDRSVVIVGERGAERFEEAVA